MVVRDKDTSDDLARKVRLATILGTAQATLTKFPYLRKVWTDNTERKIVGVSLTGIMDNGLTSSTYDLKHILQELKQVAIDTNKVYAESSVYHNQLQLLVLSLVVQYQLCDSASGIHPRYSEYYIRTVR